MAVVALSELLGASVRDRSGAVRGRVREVAIAPQDHPTRVAFLIVRTAAGEQVLPAAALKSAVGSCAPSSDAASWERFTPSDGVLLLKRDLLDQQIIDVHGRKVVRVNDVELDVDAGQQPRRAAACVDVDVGARGVIRRLAQGVVPSFTLARAARPDPAAGHPVAVRRPPRDRPGAPRQAEDRLRRALEACIRPTSPTSSRTCRRPSAKRSSRRIDEEVAAEALEEIDPDIQVSIVESLDSERAADIVEEMDPDEAADLLGELAEDRSGADPRGDGAGGAAGGRRAARVRRAHGRRPDDHRVRRRAGDRGASPTRSRR